jgi:hypothetical protein
MTVFNFLFLIVIGAGGFPGSFLYFSPTASVFGMGGTHTAFSGSVTSIYFNPAGIAECNPQEIQIGESPLVLGGQYGFFGYVRPTKFVGNFASGVVFVNSGKIKLTEETGEYKEDFTSTEIAVLFSYAKEIVKFFDFGFSYKLLYKRVSHFDATAHSFDLGFMLLPHREVSMGLSLLNVFSSPFILIEERERIPFSMRAGFLYKPFEGRLKLAFDYLGVTGWDENVFSFGIEYYPMNRFALRAGVDKYRFFLGAGFNINLVGKKIGFDVASSYHYESSGFFPFQFVFGLWIKFSGFRVEVRPNSRLFSPRSRENNILRIDLFSNAKREIEKWQFIVKDSKGEIVRIYKDYGNPPKEILWDGRDDFGKLVKDDFYYYEFQVVQTDGAVLREEGFLAEIRTIGPKGEIIFKEEGKEEGEGQKNE